MRSHGSPSCTQKGATQRHQSIMRSPAHTRREQAEATPPSPRYPPRGACTEQAGTTSGAPAA
eukprot:4229123-Prymnesium_polylepis.1